MPIGEAAQKLQANTRHWVQRRGGYIQNLGWYLHPDNDRVKFVKSTNQIVLDCQDVGSIITVVLGENR